MIAGGSKVQNVSIERRRQEGRRAPEVVGDPAEGGVFPSGEGGEETGKSEDVIQMTMGEQDLV